MLVSVSHAFINREQIVLNPLHRYLKNAKKQRPFWQRSEANLAIAISYKTKTTSRILLVDPKELQHKTSNVEFFFAPKVKNSF